MTIRYCPGALCRLSVDIFVLSTCNCEMPTWSIYRCEDRASRSSTIFLHNSTIHCTLLDWSASGERNLWLAPVDELPESMWDEYALMQRMLALPVVFIPKDWLPAGKEGEFSLLAVEA